MSYEELEYLNRLNAQRRERLCRREWMIRMGIQWGGWLLAALVTVLSLAAQAQ